jgi:hypothetical protein
MFIVFSCYFTGYVASFLDMEFSPVVSFASGYGVRSNTFYANKYCVTTEKLNYSAEVHVAI